MSPLFHFDKVSSHDESAALLTTTHNPVEMGLVRSILDAEGIPYQIRERGVGNAVTALAGFSIYGSDIFVPKAMLEKAQAIMEAYHNAENIEDGEQEKALEEGTEE